MHTIQSIINSSIEKLYSSNYTPEITIAPKSELGEYCINIFPLAKTAGKAPQVIAEEVANTLANHADIFASTSATGGYVNFFLTNSMWMEMFVGMKNEKGKMKNGKTIVVDYIGANAGKPLHIAHICTPSIGQTLCNVYRYLGYRVIGDSHFGDWGGIFGKLIYALKRIEFNSNEYPYNESDLDENFRLSNNEISKRMYLLENEGVSFLMKLYTSFHIRSSFTTNNGSAPEDKAEYKLKKIEENREIGAREEFKKLSEGDPENTKLWKKFTAISIIEIEKKLDLLNVHATYNIGESFYEELGLRPNNEDYPDLKYTMKNIVAELIEKGIATQNEDGSVGVVFPEETKMPSCVLQKKDGTGLYLTSDLAAIKYRLTNGWNPSKIIYSVDIRQQLHLKQAFWIAKQAWGKELGADNIEFFHAFNGFIKLKEGAMSTRHGTVIFLEKLIEEGFEKTREILEEKGRKLSSEDTQAITIAAIKYSYLAQDREKDVTFDWEKALNFEGNSGPYIQYAYVRAMKISESVIARNEAIQKQNNDSFFGLDRHASLAMTETIELSTHDKSLIQVLAEMESIIEQTEKTYKPHHLALYTYKLAGAFNSFYVHTPKILEEENQELKNLRLTLVAKVAEQLYLGFDLLGIKMPTEM